MVADPAELQRTLEGVRTGGRSRADAVRLLAAARLFVFGSREDPTPQDPGQEAPAGGYRLFLAEREGVRILAAYTSQALLESQAETGQRWLALPARELLASIPPGVAVVVDRGTSSELALAAGEVADIAGHGAPSSVAGEGDEVFLGLAAVRPDELLAALAGEFAGQPAVTGAFAAQIYRRADGRPPHPLIGIELAPEAEPGPVMGEAAAVAGRSSEAPVDLVVMDGGSLATWLAANGECFYRRREA